MQRKFGKGEELAGHIMDQFTRQQSVMSNESAMTKVSCDLCLSFGKTMESVCGVGIFLDRGFAFVLI